MQLGSGPRSGAGAPRAPAPATRRWALAVELLLLFVATPIAAKLLLLPLPRLILLGAVGLVGIGALLRDPTFDRDRLWAMGALRGALGGILLRVAAAALVISAVVLWLEPARFLTLPERRPWVLLLRVLAYALLSAWPQEVFYRALFFHRYAPLFRSRRALVLASGAAFAALHLIYPNAVAPLLSLPAGLALARSYDRTGSVGPAWIEHTLYGILVFALGLGPSFSSFQPPSP